METREKALAWWNNLTDDFDENNSKFFTIHRAFNNGLKLAGFDSVEGRYLSSLTGREIEQIYLKINEHNKQ